MQLRYTLYMQLGNKSSHKEIGMLNKLRKQLASLGINKAQANAGTSEGHPAIFVRWNGDEEVFTGYADNYDADPRDRECAERRLSRFKDSNLK